MDDRGRFGFIDQRTAEQRRSQVDGKSFGEAQHCEEVDGDTREILDLAIDARKHRKGSCVAHEKYSERRCEEAGAQQYAETQHVHALAQHDLARSAWGRNPTERRRGR